MTNQPLQYGDILFIQTDGSGNPNHAAIYVGTEKSFITARVVYLATTPMSTAPTGLSTLLSK